MSSVEKVAFKNASLAESYFCRAVRSYDLLQFFTHHFLYDFRWILTLLLFIVFFRTFVEFSLRGVPYKMPLVLSFFFIGFFIWVAENIATFFGAWQYPNQREAWSLVHLSKISSWFYSLLLAL